MQVKLNIDKKKLKKNEGVYFLNGKFYFLHDIKKRKKEAICKVCGHIIQIGNPATLLYCGTRVYKQDKNNIEILGHIVGIIHPNCFEENILIYHL